VNSEASLPTRGRDEKVATTGAGAGCHTVGFGGGSFAGAGTGTDDSGLLGDDHVNGSLLLGFAPFEFGRLLCSRVMGGICFPRRGLCSRSNNPTLYLFCGLTEKGSGSFLHQPSPLLQTEFPLEILLET
jgi:hypothetical protein